MVLPANLSWVLGQGITRKVAADNLSELVEAVGRPEPVIRRHQPPQVRAAAERFEVSDLIVRNFEPIEQR